MSLKSEMRHQVKSIRFSWLIVGGGALLILLGLFFDVWRTYAEKKSLESTVKRIAVDASQLLPYRPKDAAQVAFEELLEAGYKPDGSSVTVSEDGRSMVVRMESEARAYFAWMVGKTWLRFGAEGVVEVGIEGGGPVASLKRKEVSFGIRRFAGLAPLQNIVIAPWQPDAPAYLIVPFALPGGADEEVTVGEDVKAQGISDLGIFSQAGERPIAVLGDSPSDSSLQRIEGFAILDLKSPGEDGRLRGKVLRKWLRSGEPVKSLGRESDFGFLQGGTPKPTITVRPPQ